MSAQLKVLRNTVDLVLPKRPVSDSAACRKSVVLMALPLAASTGTSVKLFLMVSKKLPPGGYVSVADILGVYCLKVCMDETKTRCHWNETGATGSY